MLTQEQAKQAVLAKLADYAESRKRDVQRGAETPELAGLLVQKYGYGLVDAFVVIFDDTLPCPTYSDVDAAVVSINPDWFDTDRKRWAGRPAALTY